jgi:hypothetical protein
MVMVKKMTNHLRRQTTRSTTTQKSGTRCRQEQTREIGQVGTLDLLEDDLASHIEET